MLNKVEESISLLFYHKGSKSRGKKKNKIIGGLVAVTKTGSRGQEKIFHIQESK